MTALHLLSPVLHTPQSSSDIFLLTSASSDDFLSSKDLHSPSETSAKEVGSIAFCLPEEDKEKQETDVISEPSPLFGPSPARKKRVVESAPSTEERIQKRRLHRLSQLTSSSAKEAFDNLAKTLNQRSLLAASKLNISEIIEQPKSKRGAKRCFTLVKIELLDRKTLSILDCKDFTREHVFISSSLKAESPRVVSIDPKRIMLFSPDKKSHPLSDHHSERNCLIWLSDNFAKIAADFTRGKDLNSGHIININFFTKLSSCTRCSNVLGSFNSPSRSTDQLQSLLIRQLKLNRKDPPHISIVHQGLKHYHKLTKLLSDATPSPELYFSSSIFEE